jgi:GT2 family glycosyltransferase
MSEAFPPVSVIVPTRNRPQLVSKAVESIASGDERPAEIVVVDQSAVPHPELAAEPVLGGCRIRYVRSSSNGLSAARNEGVAAAAHAILTFTDDDVVAPPGWLATLVGALVESGERTVVSGRVLPTEPEVPGGFQVGLRIDAEPSVATRPGSRDPLVGGNTAMRRDAFERAGGFDARLGAGTRYGGAEDNDLGLRLLRAGYAIRYVPGALLYHRAWRRGGDYWRIRWRYGVGQGGFYGKVALARDPYAASRFLGHVGHYAARLPWRVVSQPRRALGDVVFVGGLAYGMTRWVATERRP